LPDQQDLRSDAGATSLSRGSTGFESAATIEDAAQRKRVPDNDFNTDTPVEVTFQHMQMRKMQRRIHGTYESDKPWTMLWVALTLLLVFGVIGASFVEGRFEFKFTTGQIGFWSLATVVTFLILVYTLTRVIVVVRWMLYWLLFAEVLNVLVNHEYNFFSSKTPPWLLGLLLGLEVSTLCTYLFVHYVYPELLGSEWFRRTIGPKRFWEVRAIGPWTLTYSSGFFTRSTCSYRGRTDSSGFPHGYGHWMDDSYHGEILTGWWEHGKPVGPFRSREFSSGYAFDNVLIGFVMASDDDFKSSKANPSNEKPPRCGVASVECSVSGGFFSHLPAVTLLFGPHELRGGAGQTGSPESTRDAVMGGATLCIDGEQVATISNCLARLRYLSDSHPLSSIIVSASGQRGLSVAGHIFDQTGKSSSRGVRQLVIDVVYDDPEDGKFCEKVGTEAEQSSEQLNQDASNVHVAAKEDVAKDKLSHTNPDMVDSRESRPTLAEKRQGDGFETTGSDSDLAFEDWETRQLGNYGTPSLRSSMQFAEIDDPRFFDPVPGSRQGHADSDLESVDYDSNTFGIGSFSLNDSVANMPLSEAYKSAPYNSLQNDRILLSNTNHTQNSISTAPHLRVREWRSTIQGHAEALIFVPGFNCSTSSSLERFGQFLAMAHLPPHIKPFLFTWPGGSIPTYLRAVRCAATERTAELFGMMLDGLYDADIRDVHIMTHSLGAQALLGAFADKHTGERSNVSMRFSLAPDFAQDDTTQTHSSMDSADESTFASSTLLRCRSITLLNPDFPLAAFVNHSFGELRRVCDHITVVGNRKDQALFWSEIGNGLILTAQYYLGGQSYPPHLLSATGGMDQISGPRDPDSCLPVYCTCCFQPHNEKIDAQHGKDRRFSKMLTVGKSIVALYAPSEHQQDARACREESSDSQQEGYFRAPRSLFEKMRRGPRHTRRRHVSKPWFDLDAIDTTWMEANVHALRHNYFNLNPILIEDLSELIVTGRRAFERSNLLHREGNIYSYCQAPACVVNES